MENDQPDKQYCNKIVLLSYEHTEQQRQWQQ